MIFCHSNKWMQSLENTEVMGDSGIKAWGVTFDVPPNTVFVMGDNREYSFDSRFWKEPYIPKVRREEDFISRLPQNIIIERTDTPFELHLINPYNNNMRCIADFEKNQIRSFKTTEQFDGALKKCIEDVYRGKDLSGQKARSAVARNAVNNIENDTTTLSKAQVKILISEGHSMVGEQTQKIEGI